MTHGSSAVLGVGTNWTNGNGVYGGSSQWLRVEATHGGGTPFVFWAYIGTLTDTTHITLGRAYPSTADDGTFNYKIIQANNRHWGLGYTRTDSSPTKLLVLATGCESETAGYGQDMFDIGRGSTSFSGQPYTYQDGISYRSAFGHNFYGEGLAHRALYYRSGLADALTAANEVDDNWLRAPEVTSPAGSPLLYGGAALGSMANVILNSSAAINWYDLRPYVSVGGSVGSYGCNGWDTRDSGYLQSILTLGAVYDPDGSIRSGWKSSLASALTRDLNCKGTDNSWANSAYWNTGSPALTVTTGSAVVTGTGLTAGNTGCAVTAMGTGTATNGSATLTGTGFTSGAMIVVTGTMSGAPYSGFYQYSGTSSPLTLSALWPGDSGPITWAISSTLSAMSIGTSNTDPQLSKNWVCRLDSGSQLVLQRPWDGGNTSSAHIAFGGKGQQPYMLGIKAHSLQWGALVDDPPTAAGFAALKPLAADWMYTTGYDPSTQGLHYLRVFGKCEPYPTAPIGSSFTYRQAECNYGLGSAEAQTARVLTAEVSPSLRAKYEAVPTPTVKTWGDTAYGSIWGYAPYTTGGVYSDSNYVRYENSDNSLAAYKWTGFFFGMGMAHQWPAVRLGGVEPAIDRSISVNFNLASVPNATQFQITLTKPSGAQIVQACPTSPCIITGDARQGAHLMRWQYLDGSGRVLAQSDPTIIAVPYPDTRPASGPLDSLDGRKVPGIDRDKHSHRAFIQSPADPPDRGFRDALGPMPR